MPNLKKFWQKTLLGRLKIMHRGVAIVLLPFLVNVVLVCTLTLYVNDAAVWMRHTRAASAVASDLAYSMYYCIGLLGTGSNGAMNGTYGILNTVLTEMLDRLSRSLADAGRHSAGEPYQADIDDAVKNIAKTAAFQRGLIVGGDIPGQAEDAIATKALRIRPWKEIAMLDSKLLKSALNKVASDLERDVQAERNNERISRQIIIGGMISNLLLACLLVAIVNRSIVARIVKLVANARTIPTYKALPEAISGQDELSELGKVLQTVSQRTIDAMEYRQTLMQMMAHDLRSPLAAGKISLEILDRKKADSIVPQDLREVEKLKTNLDICLSLINNLLVLEMFENQRVEMDMQPENIFELVHSLLADRPNHPLFGQREIENKCSHIYVTGDRQYLTILLKAVIANAIKRTATVQAPRVVLSTSLAPDEGRMFLHCTDNGAPLDGRASQRLFDKFTTDSADQLGLIVCRQIAQYHGGSFDVSSSEDTVFSLALPYSQDNEDEDMDA